MVDGTFVWIPGWSAAPAVWRGEIERWPGADHVTVDFSPCTGPADFPRMAQHALCSSAAPVRIVAWSLGAMVALEAAATEPERASALYLVGSSARFVRDEENTSGWPSTILRRMQERLLVDEDGVLDTFARRMFTDGEAEAGLVDAWLTVAAPGWSPQALAAGLDYLAAFSLDGIHPEAPAFLLHGAVDAICPLAGAERLAEVLPVCELTVWDECGHVPFWADPGRFHAWLRESIER